MLRTAVCAGILVTLIGCAGPQAQNRPPEWQARVNELTSAQSRLELRLEEVTRNLLALRERLDAQEASLKTLAQAREEPSAPPPPLRVVRLEPQPPAATAAPTPAPAAGSESKAAGEATAGPEESADLAAADLYRRAFNAYREQRYGQAILDFEEFLRNYPDHEYGDNAQYWIGESYYSQGEYQQAIAEFNRVVDRYPGEAKAPDALLKIGLAYEKLGDAERARVLWDRLAARYPDSEAARQAQRLLGAKP